MPAGALTAASVAGPAISGALGANAAGQASRAAASATQANNKVATSVYNTNTGNLQPFVNGGQTSQNDLLGLLGLGGDSNAAQSAFSNYLNSTNYNFVKNQGEQGVLTANAPAFNSGATGKALATYDTGLAGSALQGYEGLLTGEIGTGAGAAGTLGQLGTQFAAQTASNNNNLAGVKGASAMQTGNALSNALAGITGAGGSSFGSIGDAASSFGNEASGFGFAPNSAFGNSGSTAITPGTGWADAFGGVPGA